MSRIKIGVLVSGSGSNLQSIIDNIQTGFINGKIETNMIINIKSIRRAPQYDSPWDRMGKIEGLFGKF